METFLLCNTPTATHRVQIEEKGPVTLIQEHHFELNSDDVTTLLRVLQASKDDEALPAYLATDVYIFEYDTSESDLAKFKIERKGNGRVITMGRATGWRLLAALTGKTERLVKEEHVSLDPATCALLQEFQSLLTDEELMIEGSSDDWHSRRDEALARVAKIIGESNLE